jgi:class 3 adenylate cyclase
MSGRDTGSSETRTTMRKLQHDMRTPLGQILGYAEMLEEELREREQADLLADVEHVRRAAHVLLGLVDGIFRPEAAPAAAAPDAGPARAGGAEPATGARTGRLLVVDDEAGNRDLLARRLSRIGYRVVEAEDGPAALRRIEEQEFDLVLLDVIMPGMDGLEVLESIRRTRSVSALPVIMATALTGSGDMVEALRIGANDYVTKPFDLAVVLARIETQMALRAAAREIEGLARQLEIRNAFLRRTFGRYLSDEVVSSLLESHDGLEIRGEKRRVTVVFADLRGFSSLTEVLAPAEIVSILNNYLGTMADVIQRYHGTIDEFLGDAILAFFGAPIARDDDTERAVACAVAMQHAMQDVNRVIRLRGLPEVEMGVGIATGDVIVGNIGSEKRSKYGAVGSAVNLASRIESYSLGGEILVSEATFAELERLVRVDRVREVWPKGFDTALRVHRIAAIAGAHQLEVPAERSAFAELAEPIPVRFAELEGKAVSGRFRDGRLGALSASGARLLCDGEVRELAELRVELAGAAGAGEFCYARVVDASEGPEFALTLRFSTRSPELERLARELLERRPAR